MFSRSRMACAELHLEPTSFQETAGNSRPPPFVDLRPATLTAAHGNHSKVTSVYAYGHLVGKCYLLHSYGERHRR
ncbi:MAG: hypothetical protein JWO91_2056 [Acidobacteriaceae bacterium]|nr:hypothetical protein [Acidobacteriaceae bacterium]